MKNYLMLFSALVIAMAHGAQAGIASELVAYSPVSIDLTISASGSSTLVSGTIGNPPTATTETDTTSGSFIELKNAGLIDYLKQASLISSTNYSLQVLTFYSGSNGVPSDPQLYAVPESSTADPVLLSSSLFTPSNSINGTTKTVYTDNLQSGGTTMHSTGSVTNMGTVQLLGNTTFQFISVKTFKTKYLPAANYPQNISSPFYPIYEDKLEATFFGPVSNFVYGSTTYNGIAAGTITIGEPKLFRVFEK
jgi:hypothetical protein